MYVNGDIFMMDKRCKNTLQKVFNILSHLFIIVPIYTHISTHIVICSFIHLVYA